MARCCGIAASSPISASSPAAMPDCLRGFPAPLLCCRRFTASRPRAFGFTFALGAAGYMVGATIAARLVVRLGLDRTMGIGVAGAGCRRLGLVAAVAAAYRRYLAGGGDGGLSRRAGTRDAAGHGRCADTVSRTRRHRGVADGSGAANRRSRRSPPPVGNYLGHSAWPVAGVVVVMGCLTFVHLGADASPACHLKV